MSRPGNQAAGTTTGRESAPTTPKDAWAPPIDVRWQWVLAHPLRLDDPDDMGTEWLTTDGQHAQAPTLFDIDGFATDPATVRALHEMGAHVVCYIETGGWEDYRSDSDEFPPDVLGNPVDGYPDERYLDIRAPQVLDVILRRVEMCAAKGFDAIEPDLDDTFSEDTGFVLTQHDNFEFNRAVAARAHELGMSIALKNGDEPSFAAAAEPLVDFALVEQCFEFDTCDAYTPFVRAGKAVLEVEYTLTPDDFCSRARDLSFSAIVHDPALAGGGTPCA